MIAISRRLVVAAALGLAVLTPNLASADWGGGGTISSKDDSDLAAGTKAVEAKDWDKAVDLLTKASKHNSDNADIFNLLGYSERNRGNVDVAFKHYDRALKLDPNHRGAHEYVGEAYLMVGNVAKAEEHLAKLSTVCKSSCSEYTKLNEKIAQYKQKK